MTNAFAHGGIIGAAHLLLALGEKTPYGCECCVRGELGQRCLGVDPGRSTDTYCGPTVLVPRIRKQPLHSGGLCMSAVY